MRQKHKVSKCCWKNGTDQMFSAELQQTSLKKKKQNKASISVKHNKAKYNKTRYSDKGKLE